MVLGRLWDADTHCSSRIKGVLWNKSPTFEKMVALYKVGVTGASSAEVVVEKPYDLESEGDFSLYIHKYQSF